MYILYTHHVQQIGHLSGKIANPACGQLHKKHVFSLAPFARLRIRSRGTGAAVPSRVSQLISFSTPRRDLVMVMMLTVPTGHATACVHTVNRHHSGTTSSLSGHAIAYGRRLPPRVRRHEAGSPQGSSNNGCFLFRKPHGPVFVRPLFSFFRHPRYYYWYSSGRVRYRQAVSEAYMEYDVASLIDVLL